MYFKKIVKSCLMFLVASVCVFVFCFPCDFFKASALNLRAKNLNQEVLNYKNTVAKYAKQKGLDQYVDVLLAIMMVESEGRDPDVMQSSESRGLKPGAIKNPNESIKAGVEHFSELFNYNQAHGMDIWVTIQSYNYGFGFNFFVEKRGKACTFDISKEYARRMSGGETWFYRNKISIPQGGWMYCYGNMFYLDLVKQFLE
ncbi:MAG: lysozyme family protein [Oscillospiraceae bacterium]|nr:lysozyme family protein [Oscillospiraceae bacterium]